MKKCHFCGAEIVDEAVLCVHCNSYLEDKKAVTNNDSYVVCPKCQNKCIKDAVICVECGEPLIKEKTRKDRTFLKILAIIIFVIDIVSSVLTLIGNFYYGYTSLYPTLVISAIGSMVSAIIVIVGLSSNKNKKIIGIAFILNVITNLIVYLINLYSNKVNVTFGEVILTIATSFIITNFEGILMAIMFLLEKEILKKLWFVPSSLYIISLVISNWDNISAIVSNPLFIILELAQLIVLGLILKNDIRKKQKSN